MRSKGILLELKRCTCCSRFSRVSSVDCGAMAADESNELPKLAGYEMESYFCAQQKVSSVFLNLSVRNEASTAERRGAGSRNRDSNFPPVFSASALRGEHRYCEICVSCFQDQAVLFYTREPFDSSRNLQFRPSIAFVITGGPPI